MLAGFGYGFDTDGKILSIADAGGARNFTYDATQQVTSGGYASAPESYSYDPEGNRTASHLSASYTTGPANRLIEDADACYAYDANGNLATKTARTGITCNGGVTAYSWDVLNRLAAIDFADGTSAQYRYDAQGRRIEKSVNGALARYVYDDDAILLEYDGGNALQARYSHGEEIDQPLAMSRGGQTARSAYVAPLAPRSVQALPDRPSRLVHLTPFVEHQHAGPVGHGRVWPSGRRRHRRARRRSGPPWKDRQSSTPGQWRVFAFMLSGRFKPPEMCSV